MIVWPTDTIHWQVWHQPLRAHPHLRAVGHDAGELAQHVARLVAGEAPLGGLSGRPGGSLGVGVRRDDGRSHPDLCQRAGVVREVRGHRPPMAPGQAYVGIVMSRHELS